MRFVRCNSRGAGRHRQPAHRLLRKRAAETQISAAGCNRRKDCRLCTDGARFGLGRDSAKTRAVLSPDGSHYILNGAKQFITNAGMADIFIVYAKIDGDKFSAFIVDGDSQGLSTGAEEKKMGIRGSSTRSVYFDDVKVPVENLLFEIGRGHIVAFNILNIGRHKVSANALGCAKLALDLSSSYANERRQFNSPIAEFGLIKEKLAQMAIRIYAAESMVYRTGGLLNDMLQSLDRSGSDGGRVAAAGIEEYAVECSLGKVFSTRCRPMRLTRGSRFTAATDLSPNTPSRGSTGTLV